jgi:REP element-mobilizing transposase RayT
MPLAYHIVYSTYGFWLPNDPRGPWSSFVRNKRLYALFGAATKVATHANLARREHDRDRRLGAKRELKRPPVLLNGPQAREAALAIGEVAVAKNVAVLACAVMPDHVHLIVCASRWSPEKIVASCRARASRRLHDAGLRRADRPLWGKGRWVVFIDTESALRAHIRYVEQNPIRAGYKPQRWSFVHKLD